MLLPGNRLNRLYLSPFFQPLQIRSSVPFVDAAQHLLYWLVSYFRILQQTSVVHRLGAFRLYQVEYKVSADQSAEYPLGVLFTSSSLV